MEMVRIWYSICHFLFKITHARQYFIKFNNHKCKLSRNFFCDMSGWGVMMCYILLASRKLGSILGFGRMEIKGFWRQLLHDLHNFRFTFISLCRYWPTRAYCNQEGGKIAAIMVCYSTRIRRMHKFVLIQGQLE